MALSQPCLLLLPSHQSDAFGRLGIIRINGCVGVSIHDKPWTTLLKISEILP